MINSSPKNQNLITAFTTVLPTYQTSPELELSLKMLRKTLSLNTTLIEVECLSEEGSEQVLAQSVHNWLLDNKERSPYLLIIKSPWVFLGQETIPILTQTLEQNSDLDCILPINQNAPPSEYPPNYMTLRQFEIYTKNVSSKKEELKFYEGRECFLYLIRTQVLEQFWQENIFDIPTQLDQRCLINQNAYIHVPVDYYGSDRTDIIDLVPNEVETLLDIGCGAGYFGKLLKQKRSCKVIGIESNPSAAIQARSNLDDLLEGDALKVKNQERFDCVTCLDSLEHFPHPESLLSRISREFLKPQGYLIISIPNVGHWSLVQDLLAGRWDYIPIGLLCNTHYRFFTLHSLRQLLEDYNFEIIHESCLHIPMPDNFKTSLELLSEKGIEIDFANLEAHNYYILARLSNLN